MKQPQETRALYIIVNAGFANDVMEIAREKGAGGATIMNARGESVRHEHIMGISVDSEKEVVLTLVSKKVADKVMRAVKEKAGVETPAHSVCFVLPVEKTVGIHFPLREDEGDLTE